MSITLLHKYDIDSWPDPIIVYVVILKMTVIFFCFNIGLFTYSGFKCRLIIFFPDLNNGEYLVL
jgi:hypothetical protein